MQNTALDALRARISERAEIQVPEIETAGSDFDFDKESHPVEKENPCECGEFAAITKELCETYMQKNADYGNAFEDALNEDNLGLTYAAGLVFNKTKRFINLHKHYEIHRINESIEDTLLDLANYCILTVMWLRKHKV